MKYLSVCSGIEAASVAWHSMGWEPVAFSEIDPFASAVLAARFPLVPNLGDMERYREWPIEPGAVDVLVGGTPCQSFSVAGLRKGLDDPRGNLALVYLGLVDRFRPRWIVWENVPGVLSADGGRAFGAFLGGLAQLGYGFAYRVLDAQFTRVDTHPRAVPQRRRRVFVVGCAGGDARRAASVLLEPDGVRGDPPTRRASWEGTPRGPAAGARDGGIADVAFSFDPGQSHNPKATHQFCVEHTAPLIKERVHAVGIADVSPTVVAKWHKGTGGPAGDEAQNLVPTVEPLPFDTTQITHPANRSQPQPGHPCHPLARGAHAPEVTVPAFDWPVDVADPVTANEGATYTHEGSRNFRMHNVVPAQVIGFQSNLGSQGGDVFDGVSPTMRIGTQSEKGGGNPPAVALPAVFTLEVRGREGERVLEYRTDGTANALRTPNRGRDGLGVGAVAYGINSDAIDRSGEHKTGSAAARSGLGITCEVQPTLKARPTNSVAITPAVAFKASHFTRGKDGAPAAVVPPLSADADKGDQDTLVAAPPMAVRRLTPRECERLQGFPDDWTLITYRGKPAADGPRYKALGNSMATNVMRWIGLRIAQAEAT